MVKHKKDSILTVLYSYSNRIPVLFFCCFMCIAMSYAQNCTLNIGGENAETIIKVFQLNEEQQEKMTTWGAALEVETRLIEEDIQKLFNEHPQKTPKEMMVMGKKYNGLKEKMITMAASYDLKLIGIFNEKQYQRYVNLCREASRKPMVVNPE